MRYYKLTTLIFLSALILGWLNLPPAVYSAQTANLSPNQSNVKFIPKLQFANMALPVAWAARPGKIFITWEPREDATGYYIYRKDKSKNIEVCLNDLDLLLKSSPKSKPIVRRTAATIGDCLIAGSQEMKDIAAVLQIDPNFPDRFFASDSNISQMQLIQPKSIDREEMRKVLRQLYPGAARAMGTGYLDQTGLESGKSYEYRVVPVINGQESPLYSGTVTAANIDSSALMLLPATNECIIYQGDQSVELLWPKAQKILAYDIYRTASSKPGPPERLNKFAAAMSIDLPQNAPVGIVDNPIIRVRPSPQPVLPSTYGPVKISNTSKTGNTTPMTVTSVSNKKSMAYCVDAIIVSNPGAASSTIHVLNLNQPGSTPKPAPYKTIHEVKNNETYVYRIIPRDILGPAINPNLYLKLTAKPVDRVKPGVPDPLKFITYYRKLPLPVPITSSGHCAVSCPLCKDNWVYPKTRTEYEKINSGLTVSWSPVLFNEEGYPEEVKSYKLWRYSSPGDAAKNDSARRLLIGTRTKTTSQYKIPPLTSLDDDTAKSETLYWYRVEVTDMASPSHSNFSAPFSTLYQDNLPPLAPANVKIVPAKKDLEELNETQLTIRWDHSKDWENPSVNAADIAGYKIYRRVCGTQPRTLRSLISGSSANSMPTQEAVVKGEYKDFFLPIGTVPADKTEYTDHTLPPDSPYCWEYCVRAFDKSQNMSKDHIGNVTCGRLKKTKGPRAATITSLTARSNAIRIDWVAPPSVDLYSFRIFRLESGDPHVKGNWTPIFNPVFHGEIRCEDTPPVAPDFCAGLNPGNGQPRIYEGKEKNTYYFIDNQNIQSNKKYAYKIVSYDFLENPKDDSFFLADSTSLIMSTFTYDKYVSEELNLSVPSYLPGKGVTLTWSPASVKPNNVVYFVYRSSKSSVEGYLPIASKLKTTTFIDTTARPGVMYWYKVQYVMTISGHYSNYSKFQTVTVPAE